VKNNYKQCYFSKENRFWNEQSGPKFVRGGGGISYNDARKKRFWNTIPACIILIKSFRNGVPERPVTEIPLVKYKKKLSV
jgi:hypothetical protein